MSITPFDLNVQSALGYAPGVSCEKAKMKVLVAITSSGTGHDHYLARLVAEYRSMPFEADIIVISDVDKEVAPGVEVVVVDLQGKNPYFLVFAHREILADRSGQYDVFIYSEDDILITQKHIAAFLDACDVVAEDELPGFMLYETDPAGGRHLCNIHDDFRWDPALTRRRGGRTFAFFTNEQAACFILTRTQLKRAIDSGKFLVPPHEDRRFGLCESAATDPYRQCGFRKVIDISHVDDILVHHLPNKFVGQRGVPYTEFRKQIEALLALDGNRDATQPLFDFETKPVRCAWSKSLYESAPPELISLIPAGTNSLLSIGCGSGALEEQLQSRGIRVTALPIDNVLGAVAEQRGIRIVRGGFQTALDQLRGEKFDCLLFARVLQLLPDPVAILSNFTTLLSDSGHVIAGVPNLPKLSVFLRGFFGRQKSHSTGFGRQQYKGLTGYEKSGLHLTSRRTIRKWFRQCGLSLEEVVFTNFASRSERINRVSLGVFRSVLASHLWVRAGKL